MKKQQRFKTFLNSTRRYAGSMAIVAGSILSVVAMASDLEAQLPTGWKAHDLSRPTPKVVTPADEINKPPSDAIVLFDGSNLDNWTSGNGEASKWKIVDGAMESVRGAGYIFTKEKFGDCQLHVEFASPAKVAGKGQGRGNSGVFLMEDFEVQVLDSFENPTYADGSAGSIYGQHPPLVNASRGPGQWQTYDIIFHRPRFDDAGKLVKPATLTVLHNGVLIQDHVESFGPTSWIQHREYKPGETKKRLGFQDHGNPVRYRNIWIRPLEESKPRDSAQDPSVFELTKADKEKLVGQYGSLPVKLTDGTLTIGFAGAQLEMVAHSKTDFSLKKSAGSVNFELDDNGNPVKCTLKLDAAGEKSGTRDQK